MKKIILYARDPGAANTVFPLVSELQARGYETCLYGKDAALGRYKKFGYTGIDISSMVSEISVDAMKVFFEKEKPDFIITGTGSDEFSDKYIWKAAEQLGIKTFAILDYWTNYGVRFSKYKLIELKKYEVDKCHDYLPSKILVMDEGVKNDMLKEGFDEGRILISGQPFFDILMDKKKQFNNFEARDFRHSIGCLEKELFFVFASENISEPDKGEEPSNYYCGYTERSIFKEVLLAIKKLEPLQQKIKLMIKLHPNEEMEVYDDIVKANKIEGLTLLIDKDGDPHKILAACDLAIGMTSMFLFEGVVFKKPVLSVQIGLKIENTFILDKKGIVKSVLERCILEEKMREILMDKKYPSNGLEINYGAVNHVITYMEELL